MTHELKTWPEYFSPVSWGLKTFEIRNNDRNFMIDDILHLREYKPETEVYTGREIKVIVTYVLRGGEFGLMDGFVCLGINLYTSKKLGDYIKTQK